MDIGYLLDLADDTSASDFFPDSKPRLRRKPSLMDIYDHLKRDEGLRLTVYDDATGKPIVPGSVVKGHPTIGVGRCLDTNGITDSEAQYLLRNDVQRATTELYKAMPWVSTLDAARQAVLVTMSFNLGIGGLLQFSNTLSLVQQHKFAEASTEMLKSKWASQVGDRAKRLSKQMATGEW